MVKKTYIIPVTLMVTVQQQAIIALSVYETGDTAGLKNSAATSGEAAMVKGGQSSYNVWDDDWSK